MGESESDSPEWPDSLLDHMIADARRLMDRQYDAIDRGERKADGLLRLAVISLALGLSLGLFMYQTKLFEDSSCLVVGATALLYGGYMASAVGIALAGHATVRIWGAPRNLEEAPNAGWIVEQLESRTSQEDYKLALVQGLRDAAGVNSDRMLEHERQRVAAMRWIAAGGLCFLLVAAFLGAALAA